MFKVYEPRYIAYLATSGSKRETTMRIIFTDKLSKMVAQYENLRDMIFDLNTSFDINTAVETLERKVFSIMDKTYWQEKPWAHLTLNDISSQNEVRVSRYLTLKNNKITVEEEQQDIDKLGKFCSERKACRQNWFITLFIRQTNVHYMVPMFEQLGYSYTEMILPPQHSFKLHV